MARKAKPLTYEIESNTEATALKGHAVAVLFTAKYGRWFFEPHERHPSPRDAEVAAVTRAERYAKERGYIAR